jgi:hypothetical protein
MARYVLSSIGPGMNSTAATAGNVKIDNPAAPFAAPKIYEWEAGPAANSADNTYTIRAIRQTTAGTWTNAVVASAVDPHSGASNTTAANTQTAAGANGVELGRWGFHMRGGYRWVAIPGGELAVTNTTLFGIRLDTTFAQGSDVLNWSIYFDE